jgi:6-phosphogluconolactonase
MKDKLKHNSKDELENFLVDDICNHLTLTIKKDNKATLLLSGGSTPINLYKKLSNKEIPWEKVVIGLVDERYVPTDNEFSNEKMIRETLIQNKAQKAELISMVFYSNNLSSNLEIVTKKYQEAFTTVTYCLLGMGADGHTASLFTNDKKSEASLNQEDNRIIVFTNAPNNPNRRISCGYQFLIKSEKMVLMMIGADKLEVLNNSKSNNLPISKFLDYIEVHYAF